MKNKTVRLLAVELLTRVESQGTYSNLALNKVIEENNLSVKDTKLLTTIVYGVIQHKLTLEYWLEPFIKKANRLQLWVKELLLVSLYQMVYLDKIPDRAVFNESIEIAKIKGHTGIRKFVTGVLHSIRRNGLREVNEIDNDITRLSIGTSTPKWLVEELIKELGITKVESILDTINTSPKHSVRINTYKVNKQILVNELKNDGYTIRESEVTPDALGPNVIKDIEVTRHIINYLPQYIDENTRPVSAIAPGVLGTTGIETLEIIKGVVEHIKPKLLIVIDALASRSMERISSTIQISNTGIVPGAGVGNTRKELSENTLGIPVIAIGIPTVVETAVVVNDALDIFIEKLQKEAKSNDYLNKLKEEDKYNEIKEALVPKEFNFIVTPKEIDELIESMSNIVARGINMSV